MDGPWWPGCEEENNLSCVTLNVYFYHHLPIRNVFFSQSTFFSVHSQENHPGGSEWKTLQPPLFLFSRTVKSKWSLKCFPQQAFLLYPSCSLGQTSLPIGALRQKHTSRLTQKLHPLSWWIKKNLWKESQQDTELLGTPKQFNECLSMSSDKSASASKSAR